MEGRKLQATGSTKELKKRAVKPLWELRTRARRRTGRGMGWELCVEEARRGLSCRGDKGQLLLISSDMLRQSLFPVKERGPGQGPLLWIQPPSLDRDQPMDAAPLLRTARSHSESMCDFIECDTNLGVMPEGLGRDTLGSVPVPVTLGIVIAGGLLELDVGQHVPHGRHQPVHPLVEVLHCSGLVVPVVPDVPLQESSAVVAGTGTTLVPNQHQAVASCSCWSGNTMGGTVHPHPSVHSPAS